MSQEDSVKAPVHLCGDWNYFKNHSDSTTNKIPLYFDKENWKIKTIFRMRVSHVYVPSKFWVVTKESEVDVLHKYLHHFYSKYKKHYKVSTKDIKLNMYCVTYTDGSYYRSILVNLPLAIKNKSWAFAFLIDFGYMAKVDLEEIYFLAKKMYTVPQFAIRATLSGMGPIDSNTWSSELVTKFSQLVIGKILFCQVTNTDPVNKVLYLQMGEYNWEKRCFDSINDILVTERLAKQLTVADVKDIKHAEKKKKSRHGKKVKLRFLAHTFSIIEKAGCPDTVMANAYLDQFVYK